MTDPDPRSADDSLRSRPAIIRAMAKQIVSPGPRCRGCGRSLLAFAVSHNEHTCLAEHGKWGDLVVRGGPVESKPPKAVGTVRVLWRGY